MSQAAEPIRCVVVTNVPAPYRLPMWDRLATAPGIELHLVYCSGAHIDPSQDGRSAHYQTHFLKGEYKVYETRFSHSDPGVWRLLSTLKPDVVVTCGFIPTFLFAFAWAVAHRVPHVPMSDGTLVAERVLGWKNRLARRVVFSQSPAFVGACEGTRALFKSYGVRSERIHLAPLCVDNDRFTPHGEERVHDLLYCGRYVEHKHPMLAIDVATGLAQRLGRRVTLRFVGKGPLEDKLRQRALEVSQSVDVSFAGYMSQAELPQEYRRSKLFLFPTGFDVWGVVANEACAAGLPCIVSPHTGVVDELVTEGVNGHVCPVGNVTAWVDRCAELLLDQSRWEAFSMASRQAVARYNFDVAAKGMLDALRQATQRQEVAVA